MSFRAPSGPVHLAGPIYEWTLPRPEGAAGVVVPAALRCTGPEGRELTVGAFDDGEAWRARAALTTPGAWRWQVEGGAAGGLLTVAPAGAARWPRAPLRLSEDRRFLVDAAARPFFYFADTAWFIVWKGRAEDWAHYLDRRAEQGFSVVQVNVLPFLWAVPDPEGNLPFLDGELERPNAAFFRRFDRFCVMAAERGLAVCLMLIWGGPRPHLPAVRFAQAQAVAFARYAVTRFGAFPLLWSISGDAPYDQDAAELAKWEAVGAAVEAADPYAHPTTNHLPPTLNWHAVHHASAWHDFHMLQTGHRYLAEPEIADLPAAYYQLQPVKAVVNGEPWYENHPGRDTEAYGPEFQSAHARYALWASVLSGCTMGHTYGAQGIWNWKRPTDDDTPVGGPGVGPVWTEALDYAGAAHCAIAARRLRTLPWWRLRPAPERVQLDPPPATHARAACAIAPGEVWLVYLPAAAGAATLKGLEPGAWAARWLDPRTGDEQALGPATADDTWKWRPPAPPAAGDWVLILTRAG